MIKSDPGNDLILGGAGFIVSMPAHGGWMIGQGTTQQQLAGRVAFRSAKERPFAASKTTLIFVQRLRWPHRTLVVRLGFFDAPAGDEQETRHAVARRPVLEKLQSCLYLH
ncbi:MAG: hypothetical protein ACLQIB_46055 [Isosphaeraceae bacterium]